MKRPILPFLLAFPLSALAQPPQEGADMQKVMQAVQEMEQCMQTIDQSALEKLGEESKEFEKEVR